MNHQEFVTKLNGLKGNLQHLWDKISENDFEVARQKIAESKQKVKSLLQNDSDVSLGEDLRGMSYDDHGVDNYVDDLPLTINRDPSPGVKYYTTENSELSAGAEKEIPRGLDKFGEKDTFDFDEADDYQTNRDRKQNSDLSKRFYTNGMDLENLGKH